MIRAFASCVFRIVRSFRAFALCIVRFSYRSCEAFVCFSLASFALFVRLHFVRIVNLYDPGSVVSNHA